MIRLHGSRSRRLIRASTTRAAGSWGLDTSWPSLLPSGTADDARAVAIDAVRRLEQANGERISCGVAARTGEATGPADLLRAADEAQYRAKRGGPRVDVVVAGEATEESPPTSGEDRAYRAADPDARLARELLDLLDAMNGASAEERLARLRARLEREA